MMAVVGGMGSIIGPIMGAYLLTLVNESLRFMGELRLLIYSGAVVAVHRMLQSWYLGKLDEELATIRPPMPQDLPICFSVVAKPAPSSNRQCRIRLLVRPDFVLHPVPPSFAIRRRGSTGRETNGSPPPGRPEIRPSPSLS